MSLAVIFELLLASSNFVKIHAASSITITSPTATTNVPSGPLTVSGTAEPAKTVKLYANDTLKGTTKAAGDGKWSIDTMLSDGNNTLRADLYDDPSGFVNVFNGPSALTKFDALTNTVQSEMGSGMYWAIDIVSHPTLAKAYVLNRRNATVSVLNTDTRQQIASVDLGTYGGDQPSNIAISPNGSKVYVVTDTNKIVVINTSDNTIATTATVGTNPKRMAVTADNSKLYITDGTDVLVRNATSLASIATIDMTNSCHDIIMDDTDNKAIAACDDGSNGVLMPIDLSDNSLDSSVTYTSGQADANDRMAITPDDSILYVGSHADDAVRFFDPSDMSAGGTSPITGVTDPYRMVITADGNKLYVSSELNNEDITVIDIDDQAIDGTIDASGQNGLGAPISLAIKGDGSEVFAAREPLDDVAIIDTSTDTITNNIIDMRNGFTIALTDDGRKAYITASDEGNIHNGYLLELDLMTNTINWRVEVGQFPIGIALNGDETKAYVSNGAGNSVSVVDLASHTVSSTITGFSSPSSLVYNSVNNKVYVTNRSASAVNTIDAATDIKDGATIAVPLGSFGITVNPDGSRVYVASLNDGTTGKLSVIKVSDSTVISTKDLATFPTDVIVNNANTKVYIATNASGDVDVYDIASDTMDSPINTTAGAFGLGITPDDSKLFVTNQNIHAVEAFNTSDGSPDGSVPINGTPSAFGNFITETLLASTTVNVSGSLADTGQELLTMPLLLIIVGSSLYLYRERRLAKKSA